VKTKFSGGVVVLIAMWILALSAIQPAQAQTFTVLHTFTGPDGANPVGGLVQDDAGNLYGTTYFGGSFTNGVAFKIDKSGDESVLFNFNGGSNGCCFDSALILDSKGNLYGPAQEGTNGGGVLFRLSPKDQEKVMFNFGGCADCTRPKVPEGALLMDASGNLYGATTSGGVRGKGYQCEEGCGTIFKFDTSGKFHVLYSFTGGADGAWPYGPLLEDAAGNLYGVALYGGDLSCPQKPTRGCGTIFKLDKSEKLTVLYTFTGKADGAGPQPGLVTDKAGNFYGAAELGGNSNCDLGCGTLYKLSKNGKFTVLYSFTGAVDGNYPNGGLVRDSKGNLFGTTGIGTTNSIWGTVYELNQAGVMKVLHQLNGSTDGATPTGNLIRDAAGNLYGVAYNGFGRSDRLGTVFKVTP
jgi:uncharacterized repeat protein (TIGR03803 family)